MTDVKPYEPVEYGFLVSGCESLFPEASTFPVNWTGDWCGKIDRLWSLKAVLANGQTIIVRAKK